MSELGRLLDPDELDRAAGPRGKMTLDVPRGWLATGETLEVTAPTRLACARCEGGGCDGCGRSGALRLELTEPGRTFQLTLPKTNSERVRVRLVRPFGEAVDVEQLIVDVRGDGSTQPSPICRRVARAGTPSGADVRPFVVAAALLAAAIVAALALR